MNIQFCGKDGENHLIEVNRVPRAPSRFAKADGQRDCVNRRRGFWPVKSCRLPHCVHLP